MTDRPGWEPPGTPAEDPQSAPAAPPAPPGPQQPPPQPTVSGGWAAQQPPAGWGSPSAAPPPPPGSGQPPGWGQPPAWGTAPPWQPPKPGVIPLRPLGVGEILDGAISTIRAKPKLMLGLSAVVAVITQVLTLPVTWLLLHDAGADSSLSFDSGTSGSGGEGDVALTASALTASGIQLIITLVANLLLTGVLTVVLSRAVLGQDIDGRRAWEQARPRVPALLGVTLLVMAIGIGVAATGLLPGILLAVSGAPVVAVVLVFVVGVAAMLVMLVYLYVAFALAPAVVVLEKQRIVPSLRRSRRLVTGSWWRTFGILVLVNVIAQIVGGIFGGIFTVAGLVAAGLESGFDTMNVYGWLPLIISGIGSIVASTITWPFTAVATALLYVDRRIRREALDLELVRAAGLVPAGQAATPGTPLPEPPAYPPTFPPVPPGPSQPPYGG